MPVATPRWQAIAPVVEATRTQGGIEVTVLRLLEADRDRPPGGDPGGAAALVAPIAAARQVAIYQGFLDNIEPAEHPYHRANPADWLGRTARLLG